MIDIWIKEFQKRKAAAHPWDCLRLVHLNPTPLRADLLGEVLDGLWYSEKSPSENEIKEFEDFAKAVGARHWRLRLMRDRGSDSNLKSEWTSADCPLEWEAHEGAMRFRFRRDAGLSPGLFLDQRERRAWVQTHSRGLRVLNLFGYTGGFSLAAALGGASEVTTVDLSEKYIQWTKDNFLLNQVAPEGTSTQKLEFWKADVTTFLEGAARRQRVFDLVICDPPSFSRSPSGIFKLERDFYQLLLKAFAVLAPKGSLVFSTNFEGWTDREFRRRCQDFAVEVEAHVEFFPPPPDFQSEEGNLLKTALFRVSR